MVRPDLEAWDEVEHAETGHDDSDAALFKQFDQLNFYIEIVFIVQVFQKCITEYQPIDGIYPVRRCSKIIVNYLKVEFIYDLLPLIPFVEIFKFPGSRTFILFKIFRLRSVNIVLNTKKVMLQIKAIYQVQLDKDCQDPEIKDNIEEDHNNLMEIL